MIGRNGLMWTRKSLKRTQTGPEPFSPAILGILGARLLTSSLETGTFDAVH